jgi:hypothetical protein
VWWKARITTIMRMLVSSVKVNPTAL